MPFKRQSLRYATIHNVTSIHKPSRHACFHWGHCHISWWLLEICHESEEFHLAMITSLYRPMRIVTCVFQTFHHPSGKYDVRSTSAIHQTHFDRRRSSNTTTLSMHDERPLATPISAQSSGPPPYFPRGMNLTLALRPPNGCRRSLPRSPHQE